MKLIDINTEVVLGSEQDQAEIYLFAKFRDVMNNVPLDLELRDKIVVEFDDLDQVIAELNRVMSNHPFFKLKLCESPIETRFFVYAMDRIPNLQPQVIVGPYRVDLAVAEKKIAIELDGHEFHKTRSQRTNDAKRERYLQKLGWQVIRFTGTEIHKDVLECIDDAIQIINKQPIS
jgi:very-short-patch-repair endonuclease